MARAMRLLSIGLLALAAGACRGGSSRPTATDYQVVGPILAQRCGPCHGGKGQPALVPPELGTYEAAARVAGLVSLSVQRREMPPFGADATGLCGQWRDVPWLPPDEITALSSWAMAGAPRAAGGRESRAVPPPGAASPVGRQRVVLGADASFAPRLGRAHRCFVVDPRLERDVIITGLQVVSDPAGAAKNAALYALDTSEAESAARARDAADADAGWPCYGGSDVDGARLLASWSWNTPLQRLPDGTGVRLSAGRRAVMQVSYNLVAAGLASAVSTRMELEVGSAEREATLVPLRAAGFLLPPGRRQVEVTAELSIARRSLLSGLVPRMHTLGRVLRAVRRRGGRETCLAWFGHWHVDDEQLFRYQQPEQLEPGDRVVLSCTFSTTSRDQTVEEGESLDREECLAELYLTDGR